MPGQNISLYPGFWVKGFTLVSLLYSLFQAQALLSGSPTSWKRENPQGSSQVPRTPRMMKNLGLLPLTMPMGKWIREMTGQGKGQGPCDAAEGAGAQSLSLAAWRVGWGCPREKRSWGWTGKWRGSKGERPKKVAHKLCQHPSIFHNCLAAQIPISQHTILWFIVCCFLWISLRNIPFPGCPLNVETHFWVQVGLEISAAIHGKEEAVVH